MSLRNVALRAIVYLVLLGLGIFFVIQSSANYMGWIIIIGSVVLFGLLAVRVLADRARRDS
jgi:hypothetical protein